VRDHYEKLGFELVEKSPDGTSTWELNTTVEIAPGPMTVDSDGFDLVAV
jgi:hypothetical protein